MSDPLKRLPMEDLVEASGGAGVSVVTKSKTDRRDYQSRYHAKNHQRASQRVENQRYRERQAHFHAMRFVLYGIPIPDGVDSESRAMKAAVSEVRKKEKEGKI